MHVYAGSYTRAPSMSPSSYDVSAARPLRTATIMCLTILALLGLAILVCRVVATFELERSCALAPRSTRRPKGTPARRPRNR